MSTAERSELHSFEPEAVLQRTPPFHWLDPAARLRLARRMELAYHPQGHRLARSGDAVETVWLIVKGVVDEERGGSFGPGMLVGAEAALAGRHGRALRCAEELLAFTLPAAALMEAGAEEPRLLAWSQAALSAKRRLEREAHAEADAEGLLLLPCQDIPLHPPTQIPAQASLREAASAMQANQSTSVLIAADKRDPDGGLAMFSARDLIRALAQGQTPEQPAIIEAHRPLSRLPAEAPLLEALLLMSEHGLSRVVIDDRQGQPLGILELRDLLGTLVQQPHLLLPGIQAAESLDALRVLTQRVEPVLARWHHQGVRPLALMRLADTLFQAVRQRLAELLWPERPPMALLALGSEGRGEQLIRNDQDNALIHAPELEAVQAQQLGRQWSEALVALGWPSCPGGVMAGTPDWCFAADRLPERVRYWVEHPLNAEPEPSVLRLSLLADARVVAGDAGQASPLWQALDQELKHRRDRLAPLARGILGFTTPQGLLGRLHDPFRLDLKKAGLFPLIHGARVLALEYGLEARDTAGRLRALADCNVLRPGFSHELVEAFDTLLHARLSQSWPGVTGEAERSALRRDLLRDALSLVGQFKALVAHHYTLSLVS